MPSSTAYPQLAEVAVSLPLFQTYHYRIPSSLRTHTAPGKRVLVPFGRKKVIGYILGFPHESQVPKSRLKDISEILDPEPMLCDKSLEFLRWVSRYYFTPLGLVLKSALPPGINPSSKKCFRITLTGKQALEEGDIKQEARTLLEIFADLEEIPVARLEHFLGVKEQSARFQELLKRGYLERSERLKGAKVRMRSEDYLFLKKEISPSLEERLKKRAPEQARLLDLLKDRSSVSFSELGALFKNPRAVARRLCSQGFAEIRKEHVERKPFSIPLSAEPPPRRLSSEQQKALTELKAGLARENFTTYLLQGVTGSGKTEIYIRIIQSALKKGKSAMVLVPEISLTPQLISRFKSRFSSDVMAVLHSGLSPGERLDQWHKIQAGRARIVIGARSAVFAPLDNLGVIAVDEEHESAYKQEDRFPYQARDMAVFRGQKERCLVLLGSATPSLESAFHAESGKYSRLLLNTRIDRRPLPEVEVVDLRDRSGQRDLPEPAKDLRLKETDRIWKEDVFLPPLREALLENARAGHQSLLFLNRRGFASFLICLDCGQRFICPNCSVSLTWHGKETVSQMHRAYGEPAAESYLLCHYCGYRVATPEVCPQCLGIRLVNFGLGTERVEEELKALLPDARIARMDRDTMQGRSAYFEIMDRLERREIDVLIGTQMVAKGHDLPGVTLVGVLLADLSLNLPDFRSSERTFQLITQVAGRAGRGEHPGRVIIQTFNPDHYSIRCALEHDYFSFFKQEMEIRKALGYPPWGRLANFRFSAHSPKAAAEAAGELAKIAHKISRRKNYRDGLRVLGPALAPLSRLRGRTRWQMLVQAPSAVMIGQYCSEVYKEVSCLPVAKRVRIDLDRDPVNLL
jgi:primosomal protein N' (replication factor Y)